MKKTHKRAFSLVETLFVVSVLTMLLGGIVLVGSGGQKESDLLQKEADQLAIWLSNKMTQAQMQRSGFQVQLSQWQPYNYEIRLRWHGTANVELYQTEKVRLSTNSGARTFTYNNEWHTVTPAITFRILSKDGTNAPGVPVTLSGQGYVTVGVL